MRWADLQAISGKLLTYAQGSRYTLSEEDERLLWASYIHLSANWNASAGKGGSALDMLFINAPAERERARYADRPKGSSQ